MSKNKITPAMKKRLIQVKKGFLFRYGPFHYFMSNCEAAPNWPMINRMEAGGFITWIDAPSKATGKREQAKLTLAGEFAISDKNDSAAKSLYDETMKTP